MNKHLNNTTELVEVDCRTGCVLGLSRYSITRPARINPSHQFFSQFNALAESHLAGWRRLAFQCGQLPTNEDRGDNRQRSLSSFVHRGSLAYSLCIRQLQFGKNCVTIVVQVREVPHRPSHPERSANVKRGTAGPTSGVLNPIH